MNSLRIPFFASLALLALPAGIEAAGSAHHHTSQQAQDAAPTSAQTAFLSAYERVRVALAADDLAAAKRFAANIPDSPQATQLSRATSLNAARVAFKKLSADAIQIVQGQPDYYVFNCPMAGSDWVQPAKVAGNPYLGKKMPTCGVIKG